MKQKDCQGQRKEKIVLYPQDAKRMKMGCFASIARESGWMQQSLSEVALLDMPTHHWELPKLGEH